MMTESLLFFLVDDDPAITELVTTLLSDAGHDVQVSHSSRDALALIPSTQPDVILLDIMMPGMDGQELCTRLRECPELSNACIIMLSSKSYEWDRSRAYKSGANGYMLKPVNAETFVEDLDQIISKQVTLTFWGARGTLPTPEPDCMRYGGNTVCVTLSLPQDRLFIFDAGTGIRSLSSHLLNEHKKNVVAKIFISHSHWDHINALPFFVPLYMQGNEFEICGPAQGSLTMREVIAAQMDDVYFPVTMKQFAARVYFRDLVEGVYDMDGVEVHTMLLNHPGYCLGYRINYDGRSICYITDQELHPDTSPSYSSHYRNMLEEFIRDTDALITDCTYFDNEYSEHEDWGHSSVSEVVHTAHRANVRQLFLYHHDPAHNDDDIDKKLNQAHALLNELGSKTICLAPKERESIVL